MNKRDDENLSGLEQSQLHKLLEAKVTKQLSQRTGDEPETQTEGGVEIMAWTPPRETVANDAPRRILVRLGIFGLVVFLAYFAFRITSDMMFGPDLKIMNAIVPPGPVMAGAAVTIGVRVHNTSKRFNDSGFVVLAFRGGEEVEGPYVSLRPGQQGVMPVTVRLRPGQHIFSLIVFEDWKKVHREASIHGLELTAVSPTDASAPAAPTSVTQQ